MRASRYILDTWREYCTWTSNEKEILANLCIFHNTLRPLEDLEPTVIEGTYGNKPVRVRQLAQLLRSAVTELGICPNEQTAKDYSPLPLYFDLSEFSVDDIRTIL